MNMLSSPLQSAPPEILVLIVAYLEPVDLAHLMQTCRALAKHTCDDATWQRLVQENVPGVRLTSPYPCSSFRELYAAHDPYWFLTKHKIWFSDHDHTGQLIIIRYDPRRGCIEGYRVVAERPPTDSWHLWELDGSTSVIDFNPRCRLHLDDAVLQLNPDFHTQQRIAVDSDSSKVSHPYEASSTQMRSKWSVDRPMFLTQGISTKLLLASHFSQNHNIDFEEIWPPDLIPSQHRTLGVDEDHALGKIHYPETRAQINHGAFRMRRHLQPLGHREIYGGGDFKHTYATLDPELYTPTQEFPYRGVWVGEYNGHGSEFLLMLQFNLSTPSESMLDKTLSNDSTINQPIFIGSTPNGTTNFNYPNYIERIQGRALPQRALMAVKLTGDPNVPRGQDTFTADLGESGVLRKATEQEFAGVKVVKSWGHIAETNFQNDTYIDNELYFISPDKLAQHWKELRRINFYHRVNIDALLSI